jgi:hypothetical protein
MKLLFVLVFLSLSHADPQPDLSEVTPTSLYDENGKVLPEDPANPAVNWEKLKNDHGQNNQWKAIGHMQADGKPHCSSTLFKIPNCPDPKKAKAQILTNGHCTMNKKLSVQFGEFDGATSKDLHKVDASHVLFESYQDGPIDLAITELTEDYSTLERFGIKPMEIATTPIQPNQTLTNVGFPQNGLAKADQVMRRSDCISDKATTVVNETQMWSMGMAFTNCSISGGSSGSSLSVDGKIYGILNSGALNQPPPSGMQECEYDTCTFDGKNTPTHPQKNYGSDVTFLSKCYKDCKLNTKLPGCPLPDPGTDIRVSFGGAHPTNTTDDLHNPLILSSKYNAYQIKGCSPGATKCDCSDPSGYGAAKAVSIKGTFVGNNSSAIIPADYLPKAPSLIAQKGAPMQFQFLCIRGQNADGSLEDIKNVRSAPIYLHEKAQIKPLPILNK